MVTMTLRCPHCQCTVFRHHHCGFLHLITTRSAAIPRATAIGSEPHGGGTTRGRRTKKQHASEAPPAKKATHARLDGAYTTQVTRGAMRGSPGY